MKSKDQWYDVKIKSCGYSRVKNGSLRLNIVLATDDGREFVYSGGLIGSQLNYTLEQLARLGFPANRQLSDLSQGPSGLLNTTDYFSLVEKKTMKDGKEYTNVNVYPKKNKPSEADVKKELAGITGIVLDASPASNPNGLLNDMPVGF